MLTISKHKAAAMMLRVSVYKTQKDDKAKRREMRKIRNSDVINEFLLFSFKKNVSMKCVHMCHAAMYRKFIYEIGIDPKSLF